MQLSEGSRESECHSRTERQNLHLHQQAATSRAVFGLMTEDATNQARNNNSCDGARAALTTQSKKMHSWGASPQ